MDKFHDPILLITEIASFLGANGVGTVGTNLFKQALPGSNTLPVSVGATVVYHTGGPNFPGNPVHFPTFAIQHRNTHVSSGMAKIREIGNLLNDKWNILATIQGRISITGEVGSYFTDANGHNFFVANFQVITPQQHR